MKYVIRYNYSYGLFQNQLPYNYNGYFFSTILIC